jgi:hypothetical protein
MKNREIGVLAVTRLAVRAFTGSGWDELRAELHLWKIESESEDVELLASDSGRLLRSIIASSTRTKPDPGNPLIERLKALEIDLLKRYRTRNESDISSGTRYAVFPIFAGLISPA